MDIVALILAERSDPELAPVLCDAALEAGVVPPTDADPAVARERLLWLARSYDTAIHKTIARIEWASGHYNFAHTIIRLLDRVGRVRVAIACAKAVLHLMPVSNASGRLAIEAAEAWCEDPTEKNQLLANSAGITASQHIYDLDIADSCSACACLAAGRTALAAGHVGASVHNSTCAAQFAASAAGASLDIRSVVLRAAIDVSSKMNK